MQFEDCVRSRKMVRSFRPDLVSPEILERVVELASWAPSAGKTQGWHLVVLQNDNTQKFWDTTLPLERRASFRWKHLLDAPVIALVFADAQAYLERYSEPDKSVTGLGERVENWPTPYWTVDASFATMQLLLAAHDVGLGALFFAVFSGQAELCKQLNVPDGLQLIGAIAMGWPRDQVHGERGASAKRVRREPSQIMHLNSW